MMRMDPFLFRRMRQLCWFPGYCTVEDKRKLSGRFAVPYCTKLEPELQELVYFLRLGIVIPILLS